MLNNSEADNQVQDKVKEAGERGDVVSPKWGVVGGGLDGLLLAVAEISIETKPHPRCRPRSCPRRVRTHRLTSNSNDAGMAASGQQRRTIDAYGLHKTSHKHFGT